MKYFDKDKPPVCLHVLGQGLVNDMHKEGCELRADYLATVKDLDSKKMEAERAALLSACKVARAWLGNMPKGHPSNVALAQLDCAIDLAEKGKV